MLVRSERFACVAPEGTGGAGIPVAVQDVPFQLSDMNPLPWFHLPMAMHELVAQQDTAFSPSVIAVDGLLPPDGTGIELTASWLQDVPFQCSASGWSPPLP